MLSELQDSDIFDVENMTDTEIWGLDQVDDYIYSLFPRRLLDEIQSMGEGNGRGRHPVDLEVARGWLKHDSFILFLRMTGDESSSDSQQGISFGQMLCYKAFLLPDYLYSHPAFAVSRADKWMHIAHFEAWLTSQYCSEDVRGNRLFFCEEILRLAPSATLTPPPTPHDRPLGIWQAQQRTLTFTRVEDMQRIEGRLEANRHSQENLTYEDVLTDQRCSKFQQNTVV
ncbi:hypothetical protein GLOTRDRAFT_123889 [Gloeophyllum trabeum ATCC 11539]|uniref:Uncharacterized protein n=1 Tax=Gloeophyllum trabeum (strain ATCC 11539 / FP-39264 / Madison 617) TaxID=670483 RepID=S7QLD3_GLOTA|nr:uncharacterized protein GLOTRDRAFT_123889 [Gloeophyllum trabeum ATCC 11539]EPQ60132.1 hypothetical protein GLOTRDRAFT_123889 [Gloeophyllum trabeum ATCC 11539]